MTATFPLCSSLFMVPSPLKLETARLEGLSNVRRGRSYGYNLNHSKIIVSRLQSSKGLADKVGKMHPSHVELQRFLTAPSQSLFNIVSVEEIDHSGEMSPPFQKFQHGLQMFPRNAPPPSNPKE